MDTHDFDEQPRIAALCALGMLDTPPEARFDKFTALASAALGAPISLVSLIDSERQWFKSRHGLALTETPRSVAFCSHALQGRDIFVVDDALLDPRFAANPLVTGSPRIRFYAGHPLRTRDGHAVGTLCVIDTAPRQLAPAQRAMLQTLAAMVEAELNRDAAALQTPDAAEGALQELNAVLEARVRQRTIALEEKNEALTREIRQRADVEASLRRSEERVRTMIESSFSAFVALDAAAHVIEWNAAAERIFGWSRAEVLGRPWSSIMVGTAPMGEKDSRGVRMAARTSDGRDITVEMSVSAFSIDGHRYMGAFINDISGQNVTAGALEQQRGLLAASQEKLRNSEQMLRSIAENLPTLIGQVDKQGNFVYLNARSLSFYGRAAGELLGHPVRSAYNEADYAKIAGYIDSAAGGRHASFESDIVVNQRQFYYHAAFVPQRDAQGQPDGFFAMAFDITARRQSEIAQRDSEERLRTITDNVPVLISYLDSEMRYRFANAMYKDWLGVASAQMIGRTVLEVFGPDYFAERAASIERALAGHMASVEVKVVRKGHERILNTTYMPHHRDGRVAGVYVLATDATAARLHERKLLALANADPLTNLPNRRMYEFHLAKALALSKRQHTRLALMYLDLDDFKRVNDTHGHGAGDAVLVEFGRRVGASLRETDLLARLAGDEFTVVLEAVDSLENCETIAHKIQQALLEPYHFDGRNLQISASIGIALADNDATLASLSSQADEALYIAKRKGKNRYAVLPQTPQRSGS